MEDKKEELREETLTLLAKVLSAAAANLRLPLTNLHLASERIAEKANLPEGGVENAVLHQSYYRVLRLVNNLSTASELASDTPYRTEDVELVEWLNTLCRQAEPLVEAMGLTIEVSSAERSCKAPIDQARMERLLWNLLSNAMKYTPRGGKITVSLERRGGLVLLCVSDTGCGISRELLPTVFDRWLYNDLPDAAERGFGLGLSLCRRIAEGHGGRLLLESREGQGTTVTVSLPEKTYGGERVQEAQFDYSGGFQHVLMELSDALPYGAFTEQNID